MHDYFLAPRQLAKNLGTFPMADGTGDAMAELDAKGFDYGFSEDKQRRFGH